MLKPRPAAPVLALVLLSLIGSAATYGAAVPAESLVGAKAFRDAGLDVSTQLVPAADTARGPDLERLLVPTGRAYLDAATGRWATLIPTHPLVPGDGVGNQIAWSDLGRQAPADAEALAGAVEAAFLGYLAAHTDELRIRLDEVARPLRVAVHDDTVLVYAGREVGDVPFRDSFLTATVSHGNLVLFGAARWGDVTISAHPALDEAAAGRVLDAHLLELAAEGHPVTGHWGASELVFLPYSTGGALEYRLAYSIKPEIAGHRGRWEALVDAHHGELLAFSDTNHYATRRIVGGVYPESYDGDGPTGTEQLGWPMPYADVGSLDRFTDGGGNFPGEYVGEAGTVLSGRYIWLIDNCGDVSESAGGSDDIDLGSHDGINCSTPPGASPGNTHAARTTYYHLNRAYDWARSRVPGNAWLESDPFQLFAKTNTAAFCNAFWNGSVTFYQEGGGCGNMGEVAGIIHHEWGHGLDDNDNNPNISNPGEGIPDVYAALQLNESCVGRGFFLSGDCSGYGDACLDCSGIRDIDWAMRQSGEPHDVVWATQNCGGCFGITHCSGAVYAEAIWDLAKRDLPSEFGITGDRALELATRFTLVGASNVGNWFTCSQNGEDGCAAEGGYLNYIAADDIDGDLGNGTPHMTAIFDAFDRHGIACNAPAVQNDGCDGAPQAAPVVTATPGDSIVTLEWGAVPGSPVYHVFRTEGVKQCGTGKIYLGRTTDTTFTDKRLLNGFEYYYTVAANAGGRSCLGPMSSCTAATPN